MSIIEDLQKLEMQLNRIDKSKLDIIGALQAYGVQAYGAKIDELSTHIEEVYGNGYNNALANSPILDTNYTRTYISDYSYTDNSLVGCARSCVFASEPGYSFDLSYSTTNVTVLFVPDFNAPILMGKIAANLLSDNIAEVDIDNYSHWSIDYTSSGVGRLYYSRELDSFCASYNATGFVFNGQEDFSEYLGNYKLSGTFYIISQNNEY